MIRKLSTLLDAPQMDTFPHSLRGFLGYVVPYYIWKGGLHCLLSLGVITDYFIAVEAPLRLVPSCVKEDGTYDIVFLYLSITIEPRGYHRERKTHHSSHIHVDVPRQAGE